MSSTDGKADTRGWREIISKRPANIAFVQGRRIGKLTTAAAVFALAWVGSCGLSFIVLAAQQVSPGASIPQGPSPSKSVPRDQKRFLPAGVDAGYINSSSCADCHSGIAETYRKTGMGRSFYRLRPENAVEDFTSNNTFYHQASDRHYKAYQRAGRYYLRRHQIDSKDREINVFEREIHYVLGSGNHARSYLHKMPDGRLLQLPVSWYPAGGGYWAMGPGYDRPDHAGFRREIDFACMSCHNGYPEIEPGSDFAGGTARFPGWIPEGIDCQRCHGPGRDHVRAARQGESTEVLHGSIVNPARLSAERQLEVCMQCHLETTTRSLPHSLWRYGRGLFSYQPRKPLEDYVLHFDHAAGAGYDDKFEVVNAIYRLRKSACFSESGGAMTCTTCHDPHQAPRGQEATKRYSQACRTCHDEAVEQLARQKRHPAVQECISCHMPKRRTEDAVQVVMTDHLIQRFRPERDLLAPLREVHETPRNPYRGEVVLYYPPRLPNTPENELYLAIAQVKDQSNLKEGISRLEAALQKHRPQRGEFYFELAEAYRNAGAAEKAIPWYEQAIGRGPNFWPALRGFGLALSTTGRPAHAAEAFQRAATIAPEETVVLNALGEAYYRLGKLAEAVATLRKAVTLNPDLAEGYSNLGAALLAQGKPVAAEAALREAIRIRPDFAAAQNNLANVLVRRGEIGEAKLHFEQAIRMNPADADVRHNYAMLLARSGSLDEAQSQLEAALDLNPKLPEVHNNLGTVLAMKGDMEGAVRHYSAAVEINPRFSMARFNLGNTLAEQGRRSEAKEHLEKALESNSEYFEAHLLLGEILDSEGNRDQAVGHFKHALRSTNPRLREAALKRLRVSKQD